MHLFPVARSKRLTGEMTVMASGSDNAFARLEPVPDAIAGKVYRIGKEPAQVPR